MKGVKFINNRTAVKADGPVHIEGDGIEILETPTGFDLGKGATIDVRNVKFDPQKHKSGKD